MDGTDTNNETYDVTSLSLDPAKSHTLAVTGATDCVPSTAANVSNILTQTFSVTTDATAPTATVAAKSDHEVELTFNKPMDTSTVIPANVIVNNELQANIATAATVTQDPNDTTKTKFIVSIPAANNLYASSKTRSLTVLLSSSITDSVGNPLSASSLPVTLSEDTSAPVISSLGFDIDTAAGVNNGKVKDVVLNVNKGVLAGAVPAANIKVVDSNGKDVTGTAGSVGAFFDTASAAALDGDTKIVIPLKAETKLTGVYTFYLPTDLVTDNTNDANKSAATSLTLNFGDATSTFKIDQGAITSPTVLNTDGSESFTVNYATAVKGGASLNSATNVNNYTLNGAALPANTLITLDSTASKTATVLLPKGTVASDNVADVLTITGNVQDSNGDTLVPFTGSVSVLDNTAPVLQSAQIVDSKHVILTFSENMKPQTAAAVANTELDFKNGGVSVGASDTLAASSVSGHNNQIEITLANALVLTKSVTVTTGTSTVLVDASTTGNVLTAKTTVTATN